MSRTRENSPPQYTESGSQSESLIEKTLKGRLQVEIIEFFETQENESKHLAPIQQKKTPSNLIEFSKWLDVNNIDLVTANQPNPEKLANCLKTISTIMSSFHDNRFFLVYDLLKILDEINQLNKETLQAIGKETMLEQSQSSIITKDFFALELANMIARKEKELELERKSVFYSAKMFFAKVVHCNETSEKKLEVMKKMFNIVINQHKGKRSFSDDELEALNGSRLGMLIDRYRGTGALPEQFVEADKHNQCKLKQMRYVARGLHS